MFPLWTSAINMKSKAGKKLPAKPEAASLLDRRYLILTVFLAGNSVIMLEILGSKIIGPFYGVSIYVWTSLIAVTLISLTCGYWLGGVLADKKASPEVLYLVIFAAGLSLLATPLMKNLVLKLFLGLGLRMGALMSTFILFGAPLFFLGMVSPYAVKLHAKSLDTVGGTVGRLYSISTFGSVVGTILTGFLLIPNMAATKILYLNAIVLFLISIVYWAGFRRRASALVFLILPLALGFAMGKGEALFSPADGGQRWRVIYKTESMYGQIKVVDVEAASRDRILLSDGIGQSGINLESGLSIGIYTYGLDLLPEYYAPWATSALVVGLGGGIIPKGYSERGINTDIVEIDPKIIKVAEKFFFFDTSKFKVHVGDARTYIMGSKKRYDIVVMDAFLGEIAPAHLLTDEMFKKIKRLLNQDGIFLINMPGYRTGDKTFIAASLEKTLRATFSKVNIYFGPMAEIGEDRNFGNLIYAAYEKEPPKDEVKITAKIYPPIKESVIKLFQSKFNYDLDKALLLTDDYNPIDFYDVASKENFRQRMIRLVGSEILLK